MRYKYLLLTSNASDIDRSYLLCRLSMIRVPAKLFENLIDLCKRVQPWGYESGARHEVVPLLHEHFRPRVAEIKNYENEDGLRVLAWVSSGNPCSFKNVSLSQ